MIGVSPLIVGAIIAAVEIRKMKGILFSIVHFRLKRLYFCSMRISDDNIEAIRELCLKHNVARLFVFGSVLTEKFKKNSDIDMIVDFTGVDVYNYADNYFDLKFSLEKLLKREVDLLEEKAVKNPFFKKSIDSSKQVIYGQ